MVKSSLAHLTQKEELRRVEDRYLKMIEEVSEYAILLLDKEGNIENWNIGAEKIKGYKSEEVIGKNFELFYPAEDRESRLPFKLLQEAVDTGRAVHEGWRVRKDGTKFWGYIVITALHDDNGNVVGFLKVTRDLSEQKAATEQLTSFAEKLAEQNEKLRRSEDRYHRMIDEVQDYAILMLDLDGNIQNWNKGAEKIKGYRPEEAIGKNFRIFYTPEDIQNKVPDSLLKIATQNDKAVHEGWRIRKDGTKFWGNTIITALHDENNAIIGYSKVTRDLTDKKQAEDQLRDYAEQLEQNNHELEQFAYVASHDLKEPLRKILTFGDLLNTNSKEHLDERGKEYINRMQNAATRMMHLIEDLLNFSRINRQNEGFERVDLNEVVKQVIQDLDVVIKEKNARIQVSKLAFITGRRSEIGQLFQNLISNALKFNDKEIPVVNISCTIKNNDDIKIIQIEVRDNGIGFEDVYRKKIFDIFQRLHGKSSYSGSGIGLAICKKIVESHGGKISATAEPGKGSTFIIKLPLN
ncbi:MAG TPA: PAS domain S-box protein [Chitinophagaceae bacterium]|nr:PAS domain S-box protein [Chitinophagaceae bacterium]